MASKKKKEIKNNKSIVFGELNGHPELELIYYLPFNNKKIEHIGTYNSKKATSSNETKVKVSAGSNAPSGSHSVSVKQLASSAYLTGGNIKAAGKSYVTYADITTSTNFADMTDATGNSLELKGKTITIGNGNATGDLTFELGGEGENGVANLAELNSKLTATNGFEGLKASIVDGKITFTNTTGKEQRLPDGRNNI